MPKLGLDLNHQFSEALGPISIIHFHREHFRDMRGLNNQTSPAGGNFYEVASTYDIHTAGIGGTWLVDEKLKLVGDYTLSYGGQAFAQSGTWALGDQGDPMLNTKSTNNQVRVHAVYSYSPDTTMYLGYQFDSVDTNDFALLGASVGQVLTGDLPARYNVNGSRLR